ncbi:ATP-binding protein [Cupriavidus gilardii]|uniref:ATP-binding protein n=2 Tax=Cupriavidus TaxID=106589 RepID=UPI0007E319CC|nr:ATP-binding protein [Cupriavidus gilardii]
MNPPYHSDNFIALVRELCSLPVETEWLEFKRNRADAEQIGEYLSALSNSAALANKPHAYLIWGVDNETHCIVGTDFAPREAKVGNEELESWLLRLLNPKISFRFLETEIDGKRVVLLEIGRAYRHPVQFRHNEYIRIGSIKKKLRDFPEKERALWRIFDDTHFEVMVAHAGATDEDVLTLLDYPIYFELTGTPLPDGRASILERLRAEDLIRRNNGRWDITHLGGVLFARRIDDFHSLRRKAVRVVAYRDNDRIATLREQIGEKGYAAGFQALIGYIGALLPGKEVIGSALRKDVPMYPALAIRELLVNALIHQDFAVGGAGPMVEIFRDRIEITNPGTPLVDVQRFLDTPPRSRNERLASMMRRFGICEERGSGVDKVVHQSEVYQLPAPEFAIVSDHTRATLFAHRNLSKMDRNDRIRACYLHACLRYVQRDSMTNASLRERFAIETRNSAVASRLIKEAVEAGMIRAHDESAGRKYMKYVPFWA